jgi:hypothetical protein
LDDTHDEQVYLYLSFRFLATASSIKAADRRLAPWQGPSLVPLKCGKLGRSLPDDGREFFVAFERLQVNHLLDLVDFEWCAPEALHLVDLFHPPELLSEGLQRLVAGVGQQPWNQAPTTVAHAINIDLGLGELPASIASFLQNAAEDLKRMPAGYVLEIAGYTDNTGDTAMNVALSRRRADAVREALVKSGANADMLVANGYGGADPIASNDTPDGRLRNRRIEYRVLKTPDKH